MAIDPALIVIDLKRDEDLDEHAKTRLKEGYMLPGETSPQHAFARASAAFADDLDHAQRIYDYASKGWFMFATPLLSNGGSTRGLPISCYLTTVEDDLGAIFDHYKEIAFLSAKGGGVGSYYNLRSLNTGTSQGSKSSGLMSFVPIDDRVILAVSQGGTRRGSHAVYVDIWHPEIEEFIGIRKPTGGDENRKALNLHNAVNVDDAFMIAVRDNTPYDLRDPHTGLTTKTVKARDLWALLLETRMQTGEPYIFFKDTANRYLPAPQKAKGLVVNHSNLCVGPNTELLTSKGYLPIAGLTGTAVQVWNGEQFSHVVVEHTGERQELVRVWMEDGGYIDCTPYHKFYLADGRELRAGELRPGMLLEESHHPLINHPTRDDDPSPEAAYAAGWCTFAGYEDKNRLATFLPDSADLELVRRLFGLSVDASHSSETMGTTLRFEPTSIKAGFVPLTYPAPLRQMWLAGAMDAAAEWIDIDGTQWLTLGTTDVDLVKYMRLMALELGMRPRVREADGMAIFSLPGRNVASLMNVGALTVTLSDPERYCTGLAALVADVQPLPYLSDTFCFTEPFRSRGIFNGYLAGNCTEITLPTGIDDEGRKRTAVCCLSSVNADKFDEWRTDRQFIKDLMRMLDNTLTVFIERAPDELENARYSAAMERSVGLGLFGFHAYLQRHRVAFESEPARFINRLLFSHLSFAAEAASLALGAERGEAPDMAGTGQRFSHKIALAPNASSSIIVPKGSSPATELQPANIFLHKTLSGSHTVKNPFLVRELQELHLDRDDVWRDIIAHQGSIAHWTADYLAIEFGRNCSEEHVAELKALFKTSMEADQRWVVQHALDRRHYVCQAQSVNLSFPAIDPEAPKAEREALTALISQCHFMAWNSGDGLKSLYYLRSTATQRAENVNLKVERRRIETTVEPLAPAETDELGALVAAAGLVAKDSDCVACEG